MKYSRQLTVFVNEILDLMKAQFGIYEIEL
jgi:hypothetical protein